MKTKTAFAVAAAFILLSSGGSEAADALHAKFSFDGVADCESPPVRGFPIHVEGTGVLSTDRSATLDVDSNVEGKVHFNAKLGAGPSEAPGGSASLRVLGKHTLRAVRDYPNNTIVINLTVRGSACSMTVENRLKPGKRQYTFYNGSGFSYCGRPQVTRSECSSF